MAKIREDLVGVVLVDGVNLYPGDEVPDGVAVGDHVLEQKDTDEGGKDPSEDTDDSKKPASRTRKS